MKTSYLSVIAFVIVVSTLSIPHSFAQGSSMTLYQAKLNKISYQNTDVLDIFLSGKPYDTINMRVLDHSSLEKFSDVTHLGSDGLALYAINLTSYAPAVYSIMLNNNNNMTNLGFAVGLAPSGGYRVEMSTTKIEFHLGDSIPIKGILDANSTIKVTLTDPKNMLQYSNTTQSDTTGMFSTILHIPIHSIAGIWEIDATDDNHSRQSIILVHPIDQTTKNSTYCCKPMVITKFLNSPLQQFKSGIASNDVKCNQGLQLIFKATDDSPACVKPNTANILMERGWAKVLQ